MRAMLFTAVTALGLTAQAAQASWHDFVLAQKRQAETTMQIDWAEYYKRQGYGSFSVPVDAQGNPQRIHFVPQYFMTPGQMQWAVPNSALPGAPAPQTPWALPNGQYPSGVPH